MWRLQLFSRSCRRIAVCLFVLMNGGPHSPAGELANGDATLQINGDGVQLRADGQPYVSRTPIKIRLISGEGAAVVLRSGYDSVLPMGDRIRCAAEITTTGGTLFSVDDVYSSGTGVGEFRLDRTLRVLAAGSEQGYQSGFSLASGIRFGDHEYFVPGIWYRDNSRARPGAIGTSQSDDHFLIREDRMPLPLAMMRHRTSGASLSLIHRDPSGETCAADRSPGRVIDASIRVASLGFEGQSNTRISFYYPALEGDRSYLPGSQNSEGQSCVERFHPIREGAVQRYSLLMKVQPPRPFADAMRNAYRCAFNAIAPPIETVDLDAVYDASIELILRWVREVDDAVGLPFRLALPEGRLEHAEFVNFQMGFIGQQIPLAYHLIRHGMTHDDDTAVEKGMAMMRFWVNRSLTPDGLPKVWFDTWPEPHWRRYETYLRIASDGMLGAIRAWQWMQRNGRDHPEWLDFCRRFGDWLVLHQQEDGSWARAFHWDGSVAHDGKFNTSNPIPFLLELASATGTEKYLDAAKRAGEFCLREIHAPYAYVGGTPDNPNVLDKEAGLLAFVAFLELWEATGNAQYLQAARQAADYTESWTYAWNVPLPSDDPQLIYPAEMPMSGFSIIATGHSGADLFLAVAPYRYFQLFQATGDEHYATFAHFLLHSTHRHVQLDGNLGFGMPGLCTEALNLCVDHGRGRGVDVWLPWLTFNMIDPIVEMKLGSDLNDLPLRATNDSIRHGGQHDNTSLYDASDDEGDGGERKE